MRGSVAKLIRKELAPRDKLNTLRTGRVSRGEFFRATTNGEYHGVVSTRKKVKLEEPDDYGRTHRPAVMAQWRMGECPRLAAKIIKRRYNDSTRRV